jgi:large subunit ribosomal protein L29
MNAGDLKLKEREAREEIFRLKLKLRTNQLDNPSNYRRARKELARIMTVLRQKSGPAASVDGAARTKGSDARAS